jgi:protein-S-isoprenylcysteine O-methyltransferase Ste14
MLLIIVSLVGDALSQHFLGFSTIQTSVIASPLMLMPAVLLFVVGYRLIKESHGVVLMRSGQPRLVEDGVFSLVRHPMYLGIFLFLLGFLMLEFSMVAAFFLLIFAVACDWAATYEERDLVRLLGDEYRNYQKRVPKWVPRRLRI